MAENRDTKDDIWDNTIPLTKPILNIVKKAVPYKKSKTCLKIWICRQVKN